MNLSQADRNVLRASQHKLNPQYGIGNIIEHPVQSPKEYEQISNQQQVADGKTQASSKFDMSRVQYKSKFLDNDPKPLVSINEDREELDYPIALKDVQSNLWLNMGRVEFDKLEWMSGKAQKIHQEQMKGTTKFDKHGRAIPFTSESHIGSDKSNESHDIVSLVNLLDSTYPPQVTYALNVIEKIAALSTMGYYDGAFDENIHNILMKSCLLRVRHQLDSPNESICQSALKCLRALLCNTQVDEVVLDRIHPLVSNDFDSNLWLQNNEMRSREFTPDMKDAECIEIDSILALTQRTNIIQRFTHLLEVKSGRFSRTYYECILDILIRMSRHSADVCLQLQSLLDLIVKRFLPAAVTRETRSIWGLSVKALKLVRIIAGSTLECPEDKIRIPEAIVSVVQAYFFIDCYSDYTSAPDDADLSFKLLIESLRTIKVLYKMNRFQIDIASLLAIGRDHLCTNLRSLNSLSAANDPHSKISLDWQFAAHLIDLIGFDMARIKPKHIGASTDALWKRFITQILLQWLVDVIRGQYIPHLDVSIAIATAVNQLKVDLQDNKGVEVFEKVMMNTIVAGKNISLEFFKLLTRTASLRSQLLNFLGESGNQRDPRGLPSYGYLNFNTSTEYEFRLNSLIESDSPYILLDTYIAWMQHFDKNSSYYIGKFVNDLSFIRQMRAVTGYQKFDTTYESFVHQSFIAQFEVRIIARSILLLGRYYLEALGWEVSEEEQVESEQSYDRPTNSEHVEIKGKKLECYSNLCQYAISVLGLLHTNQDNIVKLKDQMFEKVLLNSKLRSRLTIESFAQGTDSEPHDVERMNFINGEYNFTLLPMDYLYVLIPIYLSEKQTDRFWIFQPILNYYKRSISDSNGYDKQSDDGYWFVRNMNWRLHTGQLASSSDGDIISAILTFSSTMMRHSPPYSRLIIRPNIEDYLCVMGSVFLDDNLFLEEKVSEALTGNIKTILSECIDRIDGKYNLPFQEASKITEPLNLPVADFFNKLVDQFEAVSYGDLAFSNFLILFITTKSDKMFRRKLFQEKAETCLSQLRIGVESVWSPKELFLGEKEKDPEMIEILARSAPHVRKGSFLSLYVNFHTS